MKQTAVEWLIEQLKEYDFADIKDTENYIIKIPSWILTEKEEQGKDIEKERMVDFAKYCLNNAKYLNFDKALFNVEEYYQIFKSK